jgi:hypothetical protein
MHGTYEPERLVEVEFARLVPTECVLGGGGLASIPVGLGRYVGRALIVHVNWSYMSRRIF